MSSDTHDITEYCTRHILSFGTVLNTLVDFTQKNAFVLGSEKRNSLQVEHFEIANCSGRGAHLVVGTESKLVADRCRISTRKSYCTVSR